MPHINYKKRSRATFLVSSLFLLSFLFFPTSITFAATDCGAGMVLEHTTSGGEYCTPIKDARVNSRSNIFGNAGDNVVVNQGNGNTTLQNPLKFGSFPEFFKALIQIIIIFAIPIIVLMIIYAGFLYVMARGSEEQVTKATRALTYAVIGGLLILGAELFLTVIQGTVNQLKI